MIDTKRNGIKKYKEEEYGLQKKEKKCLHFVRKYYILTKSVAGNNRNQEQTTQMNMASWSRG